MAFTKIVGAGIHTLSNVHTHNINSSGIITATNFVGPFDGTTGDFSGNVTIGGNLVVNGDTTTLNTTLREVELLRVDATDNTVTAGIITQRGSGDILNLFDNNTEVLTVKDGGKVGIGTVNPSQMLSVYGNIYQRGNDYITWNNGDSQIGGVSGYNFAISTYDGSSEMLERVRITGGSNGGRVGIGSVIPANKLDVALGAAWIYPDEDGTEAIALKLGKLSNHNTSFNDILVTDNDGSSSPTYRVTNKINRYIANWYFDRTTAPGVTRLNAFQLNSHDSGGGIGNAFIIRDLHNTADSIKLWTNGNSFVGVTTDGTARNFGIGTNNPTKTLHVSGSAPEIFLEHTGGYDMTLTTSDGMGMNGITVNGGFLSLAYNNKNIVMCRTGGNVGIGTVNPGRPLTITTADPRIRLQDSDSGGHSEIYTDNSNHLYLTADSSASAGGSRIVFQTDGANEKLRIDDTGKLSIAAGGKVGFTTDSNTYFEQDGYDRLSFTIGGLKTVSMIEAGTNYPVLVVDKHGTNTYGTQGAGYNSNANSNDLVIGNVSTGNHGLTICSPSSGYGSINFSDGSGGGLDASRGQIYYEHTPEELILRAKIGKIMLRNDSTDALVASGGKVGIGEDDPSTILHVENDNANASTYYLNTDAAILVQNKNSNATAKTVIKLEGPVGSGDCALVYGSGSTNMIFADRQNERLRITSSGSVNIGGDYTQTTYKLRVSGTSYLGGVVRVPNGSAAAPAIHFGDSDSGVYGDASNGVRLTASGSDTIVATSNGVTFPIKATALTSFTLGSQSALSKPLYFADAASVESASILLDNSSQELRIKNGRFSGQITFTTYNTEKLRIGSGGPHLFLGGSASVNEITEGSTHSGLVIGNTSMGNGGIAIINSTSGTGRIYFGDSVGGNAARNRGQINYYHNGDYMNFYTGGSARLEIDEYGNLRQTSAGSGISYFKGSSEYIFGSSTSSPPAGGAEAQVQVHSAKTRATLSLNAYMNNGGAPFLQFVSSRSGTVGTLGTKSALNDYHGDIRFMGDNGTNYNSLVQSAQILVRQKANISDGDTQCAGEMTFHVGSSTNVVEEKVRIDSGGGITLRNTGCHRGLIFIHDGDGGDSCTAMANVQGSGGRGIVETKIYDVAANTTTDLAKSHWGGLALIGWSGTGHQGTEQVSFGYHRTPTSQYKAVWVGNLTVTYTMSHYTLRISHNASNALNFWCILIGV